MRRSIIIFVLLLVSGSLMAAGPAKWEARLDLTGLLPADANFRDTYGKTALLPRLELGYDFSASLGAWMGLCLLHKKGEGSLTGIPTKSAQQYLALGMACKLELPGNSSLRLAAGPMLVFYKEAAGKWKASGNAIGFDLNAALCWKLSNALGLEGRLGYMSASADSDFGGSFKLGGFWGGAGIIIHF